ncbi:hypothetical protein F2Q70_00034400 [Brassica cretica]|uniref:Uncharacterized protein n=1 Tax=Brassica cretica TaxID=69181 RepID=A0A8S9JPV3_BRACR|nr:hypothetical protein F2Q70_00034400 [Brassica cretica]
MLLKGEVLGSRLTNNLIMELERTHNGEVGVGALQRCEPGPHGAGSSHGAGCHKKSRLFFVGTSDENSEEHFVGTSEDWTIGKSIEISRGSSPSVYSEELSDEQVVLGNLFPRNSVGKFQGISEEK